MSSKQKWRDVQGRLSHSDPQVGNRLDRGKPGFANLDARTVLLSRSANGRSKELVDVEFEPQAFSVTCLSDGDGNNVPTGKGQAP